MVVITKVPENNTGRVLYPQVPTTGWYQNPGWVISHIANIVLTYILVKAMIGFENAITAMAFYGVYHRDPYNQIIHFIGVPAIIYGLWIYQCHIAFPGISIKIDWLPYIPAHNFNWASVWFIIYVIFYFSIDTIGTVMYLPFLYGMYGSAVRWVIDDQTKFAVANNNTKSNNNNTADWSGTKIPLVVAAIIQFLTWYIQIAVGHQLIEGAQPAVLQSVGGAVSTAPLFAFYEALWYCGIRTTFQQQVLEQVTIYTKQLCQSGIKMLACSTVV